MVVVDRRSFRVGLRVVHQRILWGSGEWEVVQGGPTFGRPSDHGEELIPSAPTTARYWSRVLSRRLRLNNNERPSMPRIFGQPVICSGSLIRVKTGTWTPSSVRAVVAPRSVDTTLSGP